MASIRERTSTGGETTWAVLYRIDNKQRSTTFSTARQAEDFKSLVEILGVNRALAEMAGQQPDGLTLDELASKFLSWKAGDVTPRTLTDYQRDYANWIQPALGSRRADGIDEIDVQGFIDSLTGKGLSPKSVAGKHMLLHSMFKFGASKTRRLVGYDPCTETTLPKPGKRVRKGATLAEWKVLHAAALEVDTDAADLMAFIAATGWRWSEAAALAVRNVDEWQAGGRTEMRAAVAQVFRRDGSYRQTLTHDEAKSQAGLRTTRVPRSAAEMVNRRLVGKGPDDLVFTNAAGRQWYQQNFLSRTWPKVENVAGLDRHLTPHAIRHLHVALLDRSGASPSQMQRRLGHEDITTTLNTYGGMIDDVDDAVLDGLDALLSAPRTESATVIGRVVEPPPRELG